MLSLVMVCFQTNNKFKKTYFFEKNLLLSDINIKVKLDILFQPSLMLIFHL